MSTQPGMKRRRWPWLILIGALVIGVCLAPRYVSLPFTLSQGYGFFGDPMSYPVSKVVKDERPPFRLDLDQPWSITFGRGSGWHGLDTIQLDQEGQAAFHRQSDVFLTSWETATAQLPPDAVTKVLESVESNRLLGLDRAFHADVHDGTQWVLWVQQGDREKSVYFDNHFPRPIVQFAAQLDVIVARSVGPSLRWRAVPTAQSRDHERALWESLRR